MRFLSLSTVKSVSETQTVAGSPSLFRASISDPLQPQKSDIISFTNLFDPLINVHFPYYTIYFAPLHKAVYKSRKRIKNNSFKDYSGPKTINKHASFLSNFDLKNRIFGKYRS